MISHVDSFFNYARDRYSILLSKRAGEPAPWTEDTILQQYRFCNVFREDDKVTQWLREKVRNPWRTSGLVIPATITFRFFNRIESGEILLENGLLTAWSPESVRRAFDGIKPIVGAAYIIKTPNGMSKLEGLIWILDRVWAAYYEGDLDNVVRSIPTMEDLVAYLQDFAYIGAFTAYEIACDLQYTDWFNPTDIHTWANPGPGAKRGLNRLVFGNVVAPVRQSEQQRLESMLRLLELSNRVSFWPGHWPRWDMRTVEHTLCEWDKYERTRLGEGKPKQNYKGRGQ